MKKQPLLILLFTGCLLLAAQIIKAQDTLSVKDAVSIALKKNFDILVAGNDAEAARINNSAGNAGMLPVINATGTGSWQNNDEYQKLSGGTENKYPSLTTNALTAGVQLAWTLFDGGKMFVTKNKLNQIEALGKIQFMNQVLQTQYDVISAYYDVVKEEQQLKSDNEIISYDRERVKIAEVGYNAGSMMKTDLLQAKIDLNVAMENAINQQYVIDAAMKALNTLLGENPDKIFIISDTIPLGYKPDRAELMNKLSSSNTEILSSQKQIDIARLALTENKRAYLPVLNLNAGYSYSNTDNSAGSVLRSEVTGPQVKGTLQIPIFNAGENKRKVALSKLDLQTAEYNMQNISLQVNAGFENTITNFENQQKLLDIETENNNEARENLEISLQRLRLGQTTSLEVHQAQEYFVQSTTRLINIRYNLKLAETRLKQMVATL